MKTTQEYKIKLSLRTLMNRLRHVFGSSYFMSQNEYSLGRNVLLAEDHAQSPEDFSLMRIIG